LLNKPPCQNGICLRLCDDQRLQCISCLLHHVWWAVAQKQAPASKCQQMYDQD
jgi:hypothetical protein